MERLPEEEQETTQPAPEAPAATDQEVRNWLLITHLSALAGNVVPFGQIIGPLVCWQSKKEEYPEVVAHGKAALNFQLSMLLYIVLCIPLIFVVIGIPLLIAVAIYQLVGTIIGGVKASQGELYRYPLSIRFIR
ncbi:MAG: DUF4870 domain-containing protein [Bacteroidetes bacterium]|nr:MAG: DUF4870 domain-containing protein [Bacteroidota bacterium]